MLVLDSPNDFRRGASLAFDFGRGLGYSDTDQALGAAGDLLSTTRASSKWFDTWAGVYSEFGSGAPSITDKGLSVDAAATRLNTYPRDLTNAAWVKGAGGAAVKNATGIDGTANAASTFTDSAGDATGSIYQAVTVTAETAYTFSFFARQSGSAVFHYAIYDASNASFIDEDEDFTPGNGVWTRVDAQFTTPSGCTSVRIYPVRNSGATGSCEIDGVQLEAGSIATTPILGTEGSQVTRAADNVTQSIAGIAEGTVLIHARVAPSAPPASVNQCFWQWDDGGYNNRLILRRQTNGTLYGYSVVSGVAEATCTFGALSNDADVKAAFSWGASGFEGVLNGGTAVTDTGAVPTGLTTMRYGNEIGTNFINGLLYQTVIVPRVLSTAEKQGWTT